MLFLYSEDLNKTFELLFDIMSEDCGSQKDQDQLAQNFMYYYVVSLQNIV